MRQQPIDDYSLELEDIQGNILHGYQHDHASFLFLTFDDPQKAGQWLGSLVTRKLVTTAANRASDEAINIAFTFAGLTALQLSKATLQSFPPEFQLGMHGRAEVLGDVGAHGHEHWDEGFRQPELMHGLLMIHAGTKKALDDARTHILDGSGVTVLHEEYAAAIRQNGRSVEHFGFVDNISQPAIAGVTEEPYPGHGAWNAEKKSWEPIPAGCFVLGYPDAFGQRAILPEQSWLRLNGTYLVLRKLQQDVLGFRGFTRECAKGMGWSEDKAAAKLMGRWRSGAPMALCPDADDPELGRDPHRNNDFLYTDADGREDRSRCPMGAHVRRANPRDSPRLSYVGSNRMIRRGIPYGEPLPEDATEDDGKTRGLMFLAYNASIAQQFELVQQQWLDDGNRFGELSSVKDPIAHGSRSRVLPRFSGGPDYVPNQFTVPDATPNSKLTGHTWFNLPDFVAVKGGSYFFVPGLQALARLASDAAAPRLTPPLASSFLHEYLALNAIQDPAEREQKQIKMLEERILLRAGDPRPEPALWAELREKAPILSTPRGLLVTRFQDTCEVLGRDDVFTVREQGVRMQLTTGPFFLGRVCSTPAYQQEKAVAQQVIRHNDVHLLRSLTRGIITALIQRLRESQQRPDLGALSLATLVRTFGSYYGVAGPDDETLFQWFASMSAYIFQPHYTPAIRDTATRLGPELQHYIDNLIAARKWQIQYEAFAVDDVLQRLLYVQQGAPLYDDVIRRLLAGMLSGSLVAPAGMLTSVLAYMQGPLQEDLDLRARLVDAAKRDDDVCISNFILEVARLTPMPFMIYRYAVKSHTLALGDPLRAPVSIPAHSMVVCSLASAMRDESVIEKPDEFQLERPSKNKWAILHFGSGEHACLGRHLGMTVLVEIVKQLLALPRSTPVPHRIGAPSLPDAVPPGIAVPDSHVIEYEGWNAKR